MAKNDKKPKGNCEVVYQMFCLNVVVEAANAVAHDVMKRPLTYSSLKDGEVVSLANFRTVLGRDVDWPNKDQRTEYFSMLVGTGPNSRFQSAAAEVRKAAANYAERVFDTGEAALQQSFVDSAKMFKAILSLIDVPQFNRSRESLTNIFNVSSSLFKADGVAAAFGGSRAARGDNWPLEETYDGAGAALIEEIVRQLQVPARPGFNAEKFLVLQRKAHNGWKVIRALGENGIDLDDADAVRGLITFAYSWHTAVRSLEESYDTNLVTS